MKQVLSSEKIPIKLWLNDLEEGALRQAMNLANLPFAFKHIAVMADGHWGYGMPIGGVMATRGVLVPNAVGVDIGCGVVAARSQFVESMPSDAKILEIMAQIRQEIPVGFNHRETPVSYSKMRIGVLENIHTKLLEVINTRHPVIYGLNQGSVLKQLGTLGGGNHFIEIQQDQEGYLFIMVHSGSRNVGKRVAEHHNKIAKDLSKRWYTSVPADQDLAFLPMNTEEAFEYRTEMDWCTKFAKINREIMIEIVKNIMLRATKIPFGDNTDVAHNYAQFENHFGENVIVHRKGATSARNGEKVIIPGSQGTNSYIGWGRGNKDSFNSCSHGAGRKMSRKEAKKTLDLETEQKAMSEKGIIHGMRNKSDLDEASSAYKDIDKVMENQSDLVTVVHKLSPKAVIKG